MTISQEHDRFALLDCLRKADVIPRDSSAKQFHSTLAVPLLPKVAKVTLSVFNAAV